MSYAEHLNNDGTPMTAAELIAAAAGQGPAGADGAPGASAFEIAVANGFTGTETEWLASLVGADGADGDGAGTPGADGAPGDSAYQVALNNGFVGTEAEWLASLVGPAGADGADGATGVATDDPRLLNHDAAAETHSTPNALMVGVFDKSNLPANLRGEMIDVTDGDRYFVDENAVVRKYLFADESYGDPQASPSIDALAGVVITGSGNTRDITVVGTGTWRIRRSDNGVLSDELTHASTLAQLQIQLNQLFAGAITVTAGSAPAYTLNDANSNGDNLVLVETVDSNLQFTKESIALLWRAATGV